MAEGARAAERAIASLEAARNELRAVTGPLSTEHALKLRYLLDQLGGRVGALAKNTVGGASGAEAAAAEPPISLLTLPPELLAHIISHLEVPADFLTLARVCWQLRGPPAPRVISPVESAVRERSARHGMSVPAALAPGSSSWLYTLLQPERERQALVRCSPLAASEFHSAAVSSAGQLLVWGLLPCDERVELANSEEGFEFAPGAIDGLLGVPMRPFETLGVVIPRVVPGLANVRIRAVATGRVHTLAVSCKGRVYSFGYGQDGALGHGDRLSRTNPKLVASLDEREVRVLSVAAGRAHSLAVSADGRVYAWGRRSCAGLGALPAGAAAGEPALPPPPLDADHACVPCELGGALAAERIVRVSSRATRSAALAESGALFTWGEPAPALAAGAACGRAGDAAPRAPGAVPTRAEALRGVRIEGVSVGQRHMAAVGADGALYTWGANRDGELGHGDLLDRAEPTRVRALVGTRILSAEAGCSATLALCAQRRVYAWGHAGARSAEGVYPTESWLSGHATKRGCKEPRVLAGLDGHRVAWLSLGRKHALAATEDGRVFGWGDVDHAGLPHELDPPTEVPESLENADELVAILSALGSNRIAVSDRALAIRPDCFQQSRFFDDRAPVWLPQLHAWLPELERPMVHRGRPRQPAGGAAPASSASLSAKPLES